MRWDKLWKYVFPPVNLRFSVVAVLLGYVAALVYGYGGKWVDSNIPGWLVITVIAITDFVAEGFWQHGLDILNDKSGGVSGFREEGELAERYARRMVVAAFVLGLAVTVFLMIADRWMALLSGWTAVLLAYEYSVRRNECYPFVAVALAAAGGWFAATNYPGPELLPVAIFAGAVSRLSLSFYRYDDYVGINTIADFEDDMELLVYYRELFWFTLDLTYLALTMMVAKLNGVLGAVLALPVLAEMVYKRKAWCHVSNH